MMRENPPTASWIRTGWFVRSTAGDRPGGLGAGGMEFRFGVNDSQENPLLANQRSSILRSAIRQITILPNVSFLPLTGSVAPHQIADYHLVLLGNDVFHPDLDVRKPLEHTPPVLLPGRVASPEAHPR